LLPSSVVLCWDQKPKMQCKKGNFLLLLIVRFWTKVNKNCTRYQSDVFWLMSVNLSTRNEGGPFIPCHDISFAACKFYPNLAVTICYFGPSTTAFPSTPYLLCFNKTWFIEFIISLVVFIIVGLWFIHFLLSLVTYRQPMPLQLCDVSHYRLVQSWMWEILLHGHILSWGTSSCSYPYFLASELSYPPSPIHQSCFRSWGCLLATIIYSLGESSLSLSPPFKALLRWISCTPMRTLWTTSCSQLLHL
jgi:hypothetical protein